MIYALQDTKEKVSGWLLKHTWSASFSVGGHDIKAGGTLAHSPTMVRTHTLGNSGLSGAFHHHELGLGQIKLFPKGS